MPTHTLSTHLRELVSACFTGIWIQTHEPPEAIRELTSLCRNEGLRLGTWDCDRDMTFPLEPIQMPGVTDTQDPLAIVRALPSIANGSGTTLATFENLHRFMGSAEIIQALARQIDAGKNSRCVVIVLAPVVQIPEVGQRLTGDDVVRVLAGVASQRGKPQTIRVDNGPEFISRSLDLWAYFNGVRLDFSRPGKPTDNAFIESFNGRLRVACLNQHWFLSLDEARAVTEAWRDDYNRVRPHGALSNRTPSEFARPVDGHAQLPALHG